ncbi:hypothetical protein [Vibrio penaeicida]|nr:hypothetical protein [Vibrio penaeicida]
MHAKDNGKSIVATDEIVGVFRRFKTLKDQIKALETEAYGPIVAGKPIGGLDFAIKSFMGITPMYYWMRKVKSCALGSRKAANVSMSLH